MSPLVILGLVMAVLLHAAVLLFGGAIFGTGNEESAAQQDVELLTEVPQEDADEPEIPPEPEHLPPEAEPAPDASEILRDLEMPVPSDAPALEAASLSAIEQALNGQGGSGDFASALTLASGGRIGGTGQPGALGEKLEGAFSMAEIDQVPRVVFQHAPDYPAALRGKKLEGLVTLVFVVDPTGKVSNPRVEKSTHPAFERPALDALRQWKFEPGVKGGERVNCKMRVPIRFQPK